MSTVAAWEKSAMVSFDPVTLEVIRHGIISICDQIDANMTRTAFSPYIYEYKDYAVGFASADGELLAQISRRWLRVRETYGVDVVREEADPALLIAVAVCVIHLAEKEGEED